MSVRLGVIRYLNTAPLVYALERNLLPHRFVMRHDVPSACARRLAAGELDLAIVPSIEYARSPDYRIVPGVAIASFGPAQSVLLLSTRPLSRVRSVALDTSSRTSVALTRILLKRRHGFTGPFIEHEPDLDAMLRTADAALLIGDGALHLERPDLETLDLAQAWREETGLPFVFAVWTGPSGATEPRDVEALVRARRIGLESVDRIAEDYAADHPRDPEFYLRYLTRAIRYELGEQELEGLRAFYACAAELGLIERAPELRFFD